MTFFYFYRQKSFTIRNTPPIYKIWFQYCLPNSYRDTGNFTQNYVYIFWYQSPYWTPPYLLWANINHKKCLTTILAEFYSTLLMTRAGADIDVEIKLQSTLHNIAFCGPFTSSHALKMGACWSPPPLNYCELISIIKSVWPPLTVRWILQHIINVISGRWYRRWDKVAVYFTQHCLLRPVYIITRPQNGSLLISSSPQLICANIKLKRIIW